MLFALLKTQRMRNIFASGSKTRKRAKKLVVKHLEQNAQAGDTLEGITRYWMEHARIEIAVTEVVDALADLVKEGRIKTKNLLGVTYYYGHQIGEGSTLPQSKTVKGKETI